MPLGGKRKIKIKEWEWKSAREKRELIMRPYTTRPQNCIKLKNGRENRNMNKKQQELNTCMLAPAQV